MDYFMYQGRRFKRVTPVKSLFRSTMVHDVVTRGDFFAVDIDSNELTVLPKGALESCVFSGRKFHMVIDGRQRSFEVTSIQDTMERFAKALREMPHFHTCIVFCDGQFDVTPVGRPIGADLETFVKRVRLFVGRLMRAKPQH